MHTLLQYRIKPKKLIKAKKEIEKVYRALKPREQEELGQNYLSDVFTVFGDYQEVWKGKELPRETEHDFEIPMGKIKGEPVIFKGIIDEVYDSKVLGEHKTFTIAPKMSILAMNTQVCLYAKAHELETGEVLERVRWDYIRSSPALEPLWLPKSNRFSEASNSKITNLSWLRACQSRGITDPLVLAKANNYKPNLSDSFFRCDVELIPEMVDSVWEDFKFVAKDIVNRGKTNKIKRITRDCDWCNFRPICYAEFTGADVDYIKKHDYVYRERKD